MVNKYDDLGFCLNTLFDFFYNLDNKKLQCYRFNRVSTNSIKLIDIKKDDGFDYKSVLGGDVKYISKIHDMYTFKKYMSPHPATVKIGIYRQANTSNLKSGELVDMIFHYLFSSLVVGEKLKFVLLPVMNFDVELDDIKKINPSISKHLEDKTNKMYVQVFEHFYSMTTLREFLDKNNKSMTITQWKILVFQVLYALHKILIEYPMFRHNMLDLDSVYVYQKSGSSGKTPFKVGNRAFEIPASDFEIKITNFKNSIAAGSVDNTDLEDIKQEQNSYYDIHYFLSSIMNRYSVPTEMIDFLNSVVPDKFRSKNLGLDEVYYKKEIINIDFQWGSPMAILVKNNFFAEFIKRDKMRSDSESIRSYDSKEDGVDYSASSATHDSASPLLLARQVSKKGVTGKRSLKRGTVRSESEFSNGFTENGVTISSGGSESEPEDYSKTAPEEDSFSLGDLSENSPATEAPRSGTKFMDLFGDYSAAKSLNRRTPKAAAKSNHQSIMSKLPEGFSGVLPDHLQNMLPAPQMQPQTVPGQMPLQMPGQTPLQMPQSFDVNSFNIDTVAENSFGNQQQTGNSLGSLDFNIDTVAQGHTHQMPSLNSFPVDTAPAHSVGNTLDFPVDTVAPPEHGLGRAEQAHTSLLPQHLLMSKDQAGSTDPLMSNPAFAGMDQSQISSLGQSQIASLGQNFGQGQGQINSLGQSLDQLGGAEDTIGSDFFF